MAWRANWDCSAAAGVSGCESAGVEAGLPRRDRSFRQRGGIALREIHFPRVARLNHGCYNAMVPSVHATGSTSFQEGNRDVNSPYAPGNIYQADCVVALKQMPAGCVDLAFADPPFNIGFDYDVYDDGKDPETYLGWCKQWIGEVHRVLKDDGTFWLAIGDEYAAELKVLAQREIGFRCRSWVIWYYTFGVNCKNKFTRSHAHLFYFVKHEERFTFRGDDPENRIPSARQLVYADKRANPNGRLPDDTWIIAPASGPWTADGGQAEECGMPSSGPQPLTLDSPPSTWVLRPQDVADRFTAGEDTWYIPRVAGTFKEREGFHGCQMPEQLLGRIIRTCSNPGELVLDPFSGSATTLVVAKKLGRDYLGFDLSPQYVERGRSRLATIHSGDSLDGSPEPTMSAPATKNGKRVKNVTKLF